MTALSVVQGLSGAMDTLASQAYGSGEREMVGVYAQRCLLILLVVVVGPAIPVWLFADRILVALHQEPETARLVRQFALVRIPGLVMQVLATVLQKFLNNQGITKPNLWGTLAALPTSLAGSFALIPWLGFVGAPITNTLVDLARLLALLAALACQTEAWRCWGGWSTRCWAGWGGFLALGLPSMVVNCVDWWSGDIANFLYGVQSSNMMAAVSSPQSIRLIYWPDSLTSARRGCRRRSSRTHSASSTASAPRCRPASARSSATRSGAASRRRRGGRARSGSGWRSSRKR